MSPTKLAIAVLHASQSRFEVPTHLVERRYSASNYRRKQNFRVRITTGMLVEKIRERLSIDRSVTIDGNIAQLTSDISPYDGN